ncbi:MAG: TIGR03118 family protein [Gaiellaceae bacterium]
MNRLSMRAALLGFVVAAGLVAAAPAPAGPPDNRYTVTPLVSDVPGRAPVTDANVQNAWGLARSATSPWWIVDNGTDMTSIYTGAGALVQIGGINAQGVPGAPTGAVFSGIGGQFQVGTTAAPTTLGTSNFIFDAEDGTISAWRGGSTAALVTKDLSPMGASFKGLAISNGPSGPRLYAADFANGVVDVFDGGWNLRNTPGAFVDANLPAGFAPFGIQTIGSRVFVTYAIQGAEGDEIDRPAAGIVDAYDLDGVFVGRVASHGLLNAPWGLAQAPADWGAAQDDLLVGNFGDGRINAFREDAPGDFTYDGTLRGEDGKKLSIDGLWALEFGNAGSNGTPDQLFFTAGPEDESHGLFGTITAG